MSIFGKANARHQGDLVEQHQAEGQMALDVGNLETLDSVSIRKMHTLPAAECCETLEMLLKSRPYISQILWYFTEEYDREKKVQLPGMSTLHRRSRKEIAETLYNLFSLDDNVVGIDWVVGQPHITVWLGKRTEDPESHIEVASRPYF